MRYAIAIEQSVENLAASYLLEAPGCVADGESMHAIETNVRAAILFRLESLRDDGEDIRRPSSRVESIDGAVRCTTCPWARCHVRDPKLWACHRSGARGPTNCSMPA